jgi:hypothetical protein
LDKYLEVYGLVVVRRHRATHADFYFVRA